MGRRIVILVFLAIVGATVSATIHSVMAAAAGGALREWLVAAYYVLKTGIAVAFAVFVVRRAPARRRTHDPLAFAACAAAILPVVFLRAPNPSGSISLVLAGESLTLVAGAWILASALALGTCFGVLPEARGLVTRGPYRLVRHPIYLGEFGASAGLLVASPRPLNLVGVALFFAGQMARMGLEERALESEFPEYAAYAARTARLLPLLWGTGGRGARRLRVASD
jgi:protein-S-isoprenylcysteine O-methyltransferase Ste14